MKPSRLAILFIGIGFISSLFIYRHTPEGAIHSQESITQDQSQIDKDISATPNHRLELESLHQPNTDDKTKTHDIETVVNVEEIAPTVNMLSIFSRIADYEGVFSFPSPTSIAELNVGDKITIESPKEIFSITLQYISKDTPGSTFYSFQGDDGSDNFFMTFDNTDDGYLSIHSPTLSLEAFVDKYGKGTYTNQSAMIRDGVINPEELCGTSDDALLDYVFH